MPRLAARPVRATVALAALVTSGCDERAPAPRREPAAAPRRSSSWAPPRPAVAAPRPPRRRAGPPPGIVVGPPAEGDPVLVGAGDIAMCDLSRDEATAALLDRLHGVVFTLGDSVYGRGSAAQFANCYRPSWGRHRARTRPAAGNHDYLTPRAAPYYAYFGAAAGAPSQGWYSYEIGAWHVVVLNSNCGPVGGCDEGSAQARWLRDDLAAHPARCTLAYMHHPRFSSGPHGNDETMQPLWEALYAAGADVVLVGHDHHYERFAPLSPTGELDPARGLREFVVGTGGAPLRATRGVKPHSELRNTNTHGVLELTLHATSYSWRFIPVAGRTFTDAGRGECH